MTSWIIYTFIIGSSYLIIRRLLSSNTIMDWLCNKLLPHKFIRHGRTSKDMHHADNDKYLSKFVDLYYTHGDPNAKKRDNFEVIKKTDLDYLKSCEIVRMVVNTDNDLIGGYAVNIVRPLRYFDVNDYKKNFEQIHSILNNSGINDERQVCEIAIIWKNEKELKEKDMNIMYSMSLYDAYRTGKDIIIGGSVHIKIAKQFKRVLSNTLYFGNVENEMFDGKPLALVLFQHRNRLLFSLLKSLINLLLDSHWVLKIFGKKNIEMKMPRNTSQFISIFKNTISR